MVPFLSMEIWTFFASFSSLTVLLILHNLWLANCSSVVYVKLTNLFPKVLHVNVSTIWTYFGSVHHVVVYLLLLVFEWSNLISELEHLHLMVLINIVLILWLLLLFTPSWLVLDDFGLAVFLIWMVNLWITFVMAILLIAFITVVHILSLMLIILLHQVSINTLNHDGVATNLLLLLHLLINQSSMLGPSVGTVISRMSVLLPTMRFSLDFVLALVLLTWLLLFLENHLGWNTRVAAAWRVLVQVLN